MLHLVQFGEGGCQTTSITCGAFGGLSLKLNFLRSIKLETLAKATNFERLPDKEVLDMIVAREVFQGIIWFWNINWYLAYQIPLKMLIREAMVTVLH